MRSSQAHCRLRPQFLSDARVTPSRDHFLLALGLLIASLASAQDTGTLATEFMGRGVAISVVVHGPSGEPIPSMAVVKLLRGTNPAGQAETTNGRAELVVNDLGDFTVVVQAAGYATTQKDVSINTNGRAEVDVYLRPSSASLGSTPGRALLAPKAKKALDDALQALVTENLTEAQRDAAEAMRLAPGHPDVLYLQGVIFLKQHDWSKAQEVLVEATQLDPSHANALAALGMALCNQGKYEDAVAPLEKSLQLKPTSTWDTRWALAKAYYHQEHYDQALQMSEGALSASNGKAPEIELLVAQSLSALGRYDDATQTLRKFLRNHSERREAATARRWLDQLAANSKNHSN